MFKKLMKTNRLDFIENNEKVSAASVVMLEREGHNVESFLAWQKIEHSGVDSVKHNKRLFKIYNGFSSFEKKQVNYVISFSLKTGEFFYPIVECTIIRCFCFGNGGMFCFSSVPNPYGYHVMTGETVELSQCRSILRNEILETLMSKSKAEDYIDSFLNKFSSEVHSRPTDIHKCFEKRPILYPPKIEARVHQVLKSRMAYIK